MLNRGHVILMQRIGKIRLFPIASVVIDKGLVGNIEGIITISRTEATLHTDDIHVGIDASRVSDQGIVALGGQLDAH